MLLQEKGDYNYDRNTDIVDHGSTNTDNLRRVYRFCSQMNFFKMISKIHCNMAIIYNMIYMYVFL